MTSHQTRPIDRSQEIPSEVVFHGPVDILMVDDHRENLLALEGILRNSQYNLVPAGSGREALKHLLDREFALILLDVKMPEMDGFETAEIIRAREQSRHIPIIFLTAIDQIQGSETRGYAAGAVDFLFKPLNPDILRSKVRAFVDLFVKGRELQERAERIRAREQEEHRRKVAQLEIQRDRFFSLSNDMMAVLAKDGTIREANIAWEKTLGVTSRELQGKSVVELFQPQDRTQIQAAIKGLQEGRGFVTFELSHRTRDGSSRWLSWTLLSFPNEQGCYAVARDVTDRIRTGRQLEDYFENAPVGSHWLGPDGTLLRVNRAELRLLGYPMEEFVGRPLHDFHADPSTAENLLVRLRAGETIRDFPARMRCRDGSFKDVLIDANALVEEGRFIHSRGFLRDVTEQREAELRQSVNHEVTRILAEARTLGEAALALLRAAGGSLGWTFGAIWRVDPGGASLRCIETWEAPETPAPGMAEASRRTIFARGAGLPGRAWESGRVIRSDDLRTEPNLPRRDDMERDGFRQGILVPLKMGDEVLGVMEFYGRGEFRSDEDLLSQMATLGSQIGQFIERKRTEQAFSERSSRLIRNQAALLEMSGGDTGDLEAVLRRMTEIVALTIGAARAGIWFFDADRKELQCRDQYSADSGLHEQGGRLETARLRQYLSSLESSRVLAADERATDLRLAELAKDPGEAGIASSLDVAVRHRGRTAAVLRLGREGEPRPWLPEEQDFAASAADRVSLWMAEIERRRDEEEIRRLNTNLEARVKERTGQLTEALEEQEQFAYSVSHDLRAPLRAMSGFSQALYEDYASVLDGMGREYAKRIMDASERMDALIKDLLAYSRLSRAEIRLEKVDPGKLVADVLGQLEVERLERRAVVEVQEPLLPVKGNALTLTQVILNLVGNAFKFVGKDVAPRLRIRTEERGGRVRIWFEDNGIGILPTHQDRIFRIFERLNRQEHYPGTGIGLAMVRKAMSRMDGSCGVESDGLSGSRFWVDLEKA
ncbi:MAG TPA: PAS domain S-box protein [Planctomycetota bacterium]|nr:PAS domain S-box protein [Planctomycetota bacterium]